MSVDVVFYPIYSKFKIQIQNPVACKNWKRKFNSTMIFFEWQGQGPRATLHCLSVIIFALRCDEERSRSQQTPATPKASTAKASRGRGRGRK